jgi:hypothetical protein
VPKRLGSERSSAIIRRGPSRRTAWSIAAAAKIPPGHLADLAVFVRSLREHGACQTQYGGICDDAHETDRVLIWGPPTPMAW